jgi:NAD(P)-dependent dehydrogenase (short-subunit alcohol dehydrogenase family)
MNLFPSLQDKVVIITGPTGGLGPAVVRRFHDEGARLALVDRKQNAVQELFGELDNFLAVNKIDITDQSDVNSMVEQVFDYYGQIDGLVNIAGGYRAGNPLHETDLDTWEFMMNLNAKSVFLTCHAVIPKMLDSGGFVINIGAKNAIEGTAKSAVYSASKSAVFRLTESLSKEVSSHGIRVNAVYPSFIAASDGDKGVSPESLAGVIAFLASDMARDISGALIPVLGN